MKHDGIERVYRVHVPDGHAIDVAAPVVAFFHGWGGNAEQMLHKGQTVLSMIEKTQ